MKKLFALIPLLAVLLVGCDKDDEPTREITYRFVGVETLTVASEMGAYSGVSGVSAPCTMVREEWSDSWFAANVEGLDYEEGFEYRIKVNKYKVILPEIEICYEGPMYKYELKQIVTTTQRDTEGIAWNIPYHALFMGEPGPDWTVATGEKVTVIRTVEELEALIPPGEFGQSAEAYFAQGRFSILLIEGQSVQKIVGTHQVITYKGKGIYDLKVIAYYSRVETTDRPWATVLLVPAIRPGAQIHYPPMIVN